MQAPPMIELKRVTHSFGSFCALQEIDLKIYAGERVALIGSSGAGKSTLLKLLNGLLQPTQGEVWVLGRQLSCLTSHRRREVQRQVGTIYQQFHLVNNLRVIHNVNAGHLGRWALWKAVLSLLYPLEVEVAAKALEQVGIAEKIYTRTDELSGGQQQRVAIARVLVQDPAIVLADEPISSLDPELSREIMDILRKLVQNRGKTLVVSLHSINFAQSYCDRLIGLRQGKIAFDIPTSRVSPEMINDLYHVPCPDDRKIN